MARTDTSMVLPSLDMMLAQQNGVALGTPKTAAPIAPQDVMTTKSGTAPPRKIRLQAFTSQVIDVPAADAHQQRLSDDRSKSPSPVKHAESVGNVSASAPAPASPVLNVSPPQTVSVIPPSRHRIAPHPAYSEIESSDSEDGEYWRGMSQEEPASAVNIGQKGKQAWDIIHHAMQSYATSSAHGSQPSKKELTLLGHNLQRVFSRNDGTNNPIININLTSPTPTPSNKAAIVSSSPVEPVPLAAPKPVKRLPQIPQWYSGSSGIERSTSPASMISSSSQYDDKIPLSPAPLKSLRRFHRKARRSSVATLNTSDTESLASHLRPADLSDLRAISPAHVQPARSPSPASARRHLLRQGQAPVPPENWSDLDSLVDRHVHSERYIRRSPQAQHVHHLRRQQSSEGVSQRPASPNKRPQHRDTIAELCV
jgi:hypothetical protein